MCYKKPGPRCSGHAAEALTKAYQEKDPEKLQKALYDFRHTNQGIEQMAQADPEYAEVLKQERQEMLDALHRQEEMERTYRQDRQEVESTFLNDEDLTQNVPQSPGFSRSAEGESISGRESLVSHVQSEGARLGEFVNLRLNNYYGQDYEVTGSLQKRGQLRSCLCLG